MSVALTVTTLVMPKLHVTISWDDPNTNLVTLVHVPTILLAVAVGPDLVQDLELVTVRDPVRNPATAMVLAVDPDLAQDLVLALALEQQLFPVLIVKVKLLHIQQPFPDMAMD